MSATAGPTNSSPPGTDPERLRRQSELLTRRRRGRERRFNVGVRVSYVVLFLLLALLFSGIDLRDSGIPLRTIRLDWAFIRSYAPFIFQGVWLTILLSILAIALSVVLAIAGALGRLSKSPPAYALATFYVCLLYTSRCV